MLEDLFVVPSAAERFRSCVLGDHLDEFCVGLARRGYQASTIRDKLRMLSHLADWMVDKQLAVVELDERRVDEFVRARRRRGRSCGRFRRAGRLLVQHLRCGGVVGEPERARDNSPGAALLARYDEYLRRERGLADTTVSAYLSSVREFLVEKVDGGAGQLGALRAGAVGDFLVGCVPRVGDRQAQYMATALRSFLRFLFLRGETASDLSRAVPTVRRQPSTVPRHLSGRDVERLLRACDRSSATGRRDHAVLLLLARLGLRANEVVTLELDDLNWRAGEIVVRGKGLLRDHLPLLPDVGRALALYLQKDRPAGDSRRVFLCKGAPYRGLGYASTVCSIVAAALVRAGLAPAVHGAHLLRHSLATAMLRRGASFSEIGQVLRHRSPKSTEIYAKVDFDALREVTMPWPTAGGAR